MIEKKFDVVVVGGGSAGMSAALTIEEQGYKVAIVERENFLGGILLQCIHNGFGLHTFKEELTGPEYASRFEELTNKSNIEVFTESTVLEIEENNDYKTVYCYSAKHKSMALTSKAVVLSVGCRERNRGNIGVPGSRPAGVYTAGLAQRLVNMEGYIPGKDVVIVGSGDIGLIMARRMTWVGAKVHAVVEIQPYPSGLTRNIVQCLNDFDIPLYLSHTVTKINGKNRIESVDITPIIDGVQDHSKTFNVKCDTLLLSVGLVPETELLRKLDANINPVTKGPYVDANYMTDDEGIFACGNGLHVHDLVDYVTEESKRCGKSVIKYLENDYSKNQYSIEAGANIRYTAPTKYLADGETKVYFRPMIVKNNATLSIKQGNQVIKEKKLRHVQPSEMLNVLIDGNKLNYTNDKETTLEISVY